MRIGRSILFSCFLIAVILHSAVARQTSVSVPQAVTILQRALKAMGSSVPADSTATGNVTVVEGSNTDTGTIQILTRGLTQTSETINLPNRERLIVFSNGDAKEGSGADSAIVPLELAVTDQSSAFPLALLSSALNNPDGVFTYIGQESFNGIAADHVRIFTSFASKPKLQPLASFSTKDVWFDASSGLPVKLSYTRRAASGDAPAFAVEILFSDYRTVGSILYPFQTKKSYNGTPWQTITIQNVSLNSGLTDSQFQVQ